MLVNFSWAWDRAVLGETRCHDGGWVVGGRNRVPGWRLRLEVTARDIT